MRKIKFKAKDQYNGDWIYGYPLQDSDIRDRWYIMHNYSDGIIIDAKTISQFTGLTDKNGKEIYEGDILLSQGQNKKFIQVVEFHNTDKTCGRGWVGINHVQIELINGEEIKNKISDRFSYFSFPCSCEIIGNIHDNPELLTK